MRILSIKLTLVCFLGFISCSKNALFELDPGPIAMAALEQTPVAVQYSETPQRQKTRPAAPLATVTLQVVRSVVSAETGHYLLYFSGAAEPALLQLADQQILSFLDRDGQVVTRALPVISYSLVDQLLEVAFGTGRDPDDELEPEGEQSIIVVDVVVN